MLVFVSFIILFSTIFYFYFDGKRKKNLLKKSIAQRKHEQNVNFDWIQNNYERLEEVEAERIVEIPYEELKDQLKSGILKPSDVLRAFQRKTMEAHNVTNCVCLFIEEAVDIAKRLDGTVVEERYSMPLFGVPVSVKESIKVKGMDSTQGLSQALFKPSKANSESVKQLIRLGAIPFVHTNIPQALLSFGCCNPIYGSTSNPHDVTRVPGGSSGGESALIASGGAHFGVGTDVGGSIRTPAAFCGLVGFKSCSWRTSQTGKVASIPGRQLLKSVEGPLAKSVDVCVDYLRLKWNDDSLFESDVYMPPVKFQEELFESKLKLRIGHYTFDGYHKAPRAYERAVNETVKFLRTQGHDLVEFAVPDPDLMYSVFCAGATSDGSVYLNKLLSKDIVPDECYIGMPITKLPYFCQKLLRNHLPMRRVRNVLKELPHDCEEMREMHEKIEDYRHQFVVHMRKNNIDAIICPAFGSYPPKHGAPNKMISAASYTALYNLIDFAAGVVPVGSVGQDEMDYEGVEGDIWDNLVEENLKGCAGLPTSVQIVTPPFREETCLRLMKTIETHFAHRK